MTLRNKLQGGERCVGVSRDVSGNRLSDRRLARVLELYRKTIDFSPVGILAYHARSGRCVLANEAAARIVGGTVKRLLRQNFRKIASWKANGLLKLADESLSQNQEKRATTRVLSPLGKEMWFDVVMTQFATHGEKHLLAMIEDITARKQAETALEISETMYRNLVETMNEGLGVKDKNDVITFMNKRACEMLGYERDELIGKPIYILFDKADQKILREQLKKRAAGGWQSYEIRWKRKDGSKLDTIISPCPRFDEKGEIFESVAVFTDITGLKLAEAALREKNLALKEVLAQIETEKLEIRQRVAANVEKLILPGMSRLKAKAETAELCQLRLLEVNLRDLTSKFGVQIGKGATSLSARETEICNMLRSGMSSKEMAQALGVSLRTVDAFRNRIRKKLGISGKRANLFTYLQTFS